MFQVFALFVNTKFLANSASFSMVRLVMKHLTLFYVIVFKSA